MDTSYQLYEWISTKLRAVYQYEIGYGDFDTKRLSSKPVNTILDKTDVFFMFAFRGKWAPNLVLMPLNSVPGLGHATTWKWAIKTKIAFIKVRLNFSSKSTTTRCQCSPYGIPFYNWLRYNHITVDIIYYLGSLLVYGGYVFASFSFKFASQLR